MKKERSLIVICLFMTITASLFANDHERDIIFTNIGIENDDQDFIFQSNIYDIYKLFYDYGNLVQKIDEDEPVYVFLDKKHFIILQSQSIKETYYITIQVLEIENSKIVYSDIFQVSSKEKFYGIFPGVIKSLENNFLKLKKLTSQQVNSNK